VRFEIVPGGHLGMLTGRAARRTTWVVMDEWISQWSTEEEEPSAKSTAKKTTSAAAIGTNPSRRHTSAASRALKQ